MGVYNSSATRVEPVFRLLQKQGNDWLKQLLALPSLGHPKPHDWHGLSLYPEEVLYGDSEKALAAPAGLLDWLLINRLDVTGQGLEGLSKETADKRRRLLGGDVDMIEQGRQQLRADRSSRQWYVLEGPSYPDVYVRTRDLIVVIEGKRTETGPTTSTTWMLVRHQMLRHLDAAYESAGAKTVLGLFIVEGDSDGQVPKVWLDAAKSTISQDALCGSLPHRNKDEIDAIARGFLGVTTWLAVCKAFGIDYRSLPETTD